MAIAARTPRAARNGWPIILRTKVMDDWIMQSVAAGCDGVLNLAAGLDTRPYRLPLPASLDWIEVDLPLMIEEKTRALADAAPLCLMTRRAVDLADARARKDLLDDVLSRHGRLLVITEGLLMYLDDASVGSLARDLCRPGVESWLFDILSPAVRNDIMRGMKRELKQAPMQFAPSDGVAFFERLGGQSGKCARRCRRRIGSSGCRWCFNSWPACRCRPPIRGASAGRDGAASCG